LTSQDDEQQQQGPDYYYDELPLIEEPPARPATRKNKQGKQATNVGEKTQQRQQPTRTPSGVKEDEQLSPFDDSVPELPAPTPKINRPPVVAKVPAVNRPLQTQRIAKKQLTSNSKTPVASNTRFSSRTGEQVAQESHTKVTRSSGPAPVSDEVDDVEDLLKNHRLDHEDPLPAA
jgi:hypothetical protein